MFFFDEGIFLATSAAPGASCVRDLAVHNISWTKSNVLEVFFHSGFSEEFKDGEVRLGGGR